MNNIARHLLGTGFVGATCALALGCGGNAPLQPTAPAQLTVVAGAARGDSAEADVLSGNRTRAVDLGTCTNLQAPAGSKLAVHLYATGVQIYSWSGTSWVFIAPSAVLSADAGGHSTVGTHYAGPTWESNSGSTVVGTVFERCTVSASAIPWLSLTAVSSEGPGIFDA